MNCTTLVGTIVKDPELKDAGKSQVLKLRVKTPRTIVREDGITESADYHNVVYWGKRAGIVHSALQQGDLVQVRGANRTRSYDGKDGTKKYVFEVEADVVAPFAAPVDSATES